MALTPFKSNLIADCGISFGDEGKGRLVSEVAEELRQSTETDNPLAVVVKVNGGANSGHTAGGLKLNLLPAAVVEGGVDTLAIGAGVVADPRKFLWESKPLDAQGYRVLDRLAIDERTMVSDLSHRLLDLAWEWYRANVLGEEPRGSTGRGITPAYMDEVGQFQIFYADFLGDRDVFERRLRQRADRALRTIRHVCQVDETAWHGFFDTLSEAESKANAASVEAGIFPAETFDFAPFKGKDPFELELDLLSETYWQAGQELVGRIADVREIVRVARRSGRYVIGEFGQAYWLDKRHGFPPNVSASHTYAPEFFNSVGAHPQPLHVIGVAKAYDTKVGTHHFITQVDQPHRLFDRLKRLEFGTSTGRQRMVGWYDAVEKADALRYGGFDDLMINKLDALGHGDGWNGDLKICVAYETPDGRRLRRVPRSEAVRKTLRPVYADYPGWKEDISQARKFSDLPPNAQAYVGGMVNSVIHAAFQDESSPKQLPNLRYLGVGPMPNQVIRDIPPVRDLARLDPNSRQGR